jgi:ERCC4-type nuclease
VRIVADVRERFSGVPRLLSGTGLDVTMEWLRCGDRAAGGGALVERKRVRGMHAAIVAGTFWPQIGRLRAMDSCDSALWLHVTLREAENDVTQGCHS